MSRPTAPSYLLVFAWILISSSATVTNAVLPPHNPPWPPTYNMTESLLTMQLNSSGWSDSARGAEFGIVSYDWSNAKRLWAAAKPMTCEELLLEQAQRTKQAGAKHVFVYRNIVKALPWFRQVREKMNDPQYDGFFLPFDPQLPQQNYHVPPCAAENATLCSPLYHDQEQTPQVPTADHPRGFCVDYCDCGRKHPCGEYLFDHRNGTMLRNFLVQDVVLGAILTSTSAIDGLFLDDYWCSNLLCEESNNTVAGCPCDDPVQGPTEIDKYSQVDMGLSDQDIKDITVEWNKTMTAVHQVLLDHGAYTWSLIPGQENANAMPVLLSSNQTECIDMLKSACQPNAIWQKLPLLFGFTVTNHTVLAQLEQDLAFFLLARGPYAFAGWGIWGMTWPFNAEPAHGELPPLPHGVPVPSELHQDFGVPTMEHCVASSPSAGVFYREWSRADVQLDCNTFQARIEFKEEKEKLSTSS